MIQQSLWESPAAYAVIDGQYRYVLHRSWAASRGVLLFILLNPSTADGHEDDATVRKCKAIASRRGYGGIAIGNLYALRATSFDRRADEVLGMIAKAGQEARALRVNATGHPMHPLYAPTGLRPVSYRFRRPMPRRMVG